MSELGAVSLVVKRLEQRVRFVDELLNALRRWIFAPLRGSYSKRNVGERRAKRGDPDAEADPKEHPREPPLFAVLKTFGLESWVWRLHDVYSSRKGAPGPYLVPREIGVARETSSTNCCVEDFE